MEFESAIKKTYGYFFKSHHSNDCHGWPYSTPFDQTNFSVHFRLFGQKVNKQNCRIWGSGNPNVIIEKPMHPQKVRINPNHSDLGLIPILWPGSDSNARSSSFYGIASSARVVDVLMVEISLKTSF